MRRRTTRTRIASWKCGHFSPVSVEDVEGGKRTRCLMCEECGDVREGAEEAFYALREGRVNATRHKAPNSSSPPPSIHPTSQK